MRPVNKRQPAFPGNAVRMEALSKRQLIRNALISNFGFYCSFCEMPLGGYEIEHHRRFAAWKTEISTDDWPDLLLICNDCRTHIRKPVISEQDAKTMLWPDLDLTFGVHTLSPLLYDLRSVRFVNEDKKGNVESAEIKQLVFVTTNPACDTETQEKAQNTIDHFQLNMRIDFYDPSSNELHLPYEYSQQRLDNRMFKRTDAWFEATRAKARLDAIRLMGTSLSRLLIEQIAAHAHFSGNWSVWMTVFHNEKVDNETLQELFTKDEHYFTGTNILGVFKST